MKKIIILLFIFFSFWIIQTNASTLLDEVQNYYQLENNWNDSHTWSNLTVNWSFTNVKKVLWTYSFNRSSLAYDLYSLDNSFDFPWDFSISLWVNMTNMTNSSQTIFSKQDTIRNYRLDYDETNKRFAYYSTDTGWVYSNFIDLSSSVWYNIAFVRSWNEITFYNNWLSYWTFTISWISQTNWWYLTIWNYTPTNSTWFTSTWDEISIFPIALSSDDISNLYNWWAWLSYFDFSITNYVWNWLPDLAFTSTGELIPTLNGFTLSGTIINVDHKLTEISIFEYEAWTPFLNTFDERITLIYWSWWIELDQNILSDLDFTFSAFQDYEIELTFETLDWLQTISNFYTYWDYIYNAWYSEPEINNFSFQVSWFTWFENGFSLNNFIPNPTWWKLYFEIIAPVNWWTGTLDLTTDTFLPYWIQGWWYWFDSSVIITYPYHQTAWIYQVRPVYDYDDLIIYPFWTEYNSYEITLAEIPSDDPLNDNVCDFNQDWFIDTWEQLDCVFSSEVWIWWFFNNISLMITKIKSLFQKVESMAQPVEAKDFLSFFIPTTNASVIDSFDTFDDTSIENEPVLKNSYFILCFSVILWYYFYNKKILIC